MGDDYNHIKNVLRMARGDNLTLCNGSGTDYEGVLEDFKDGTVIIRIASFYKNTSEPDVKVTLFQGIPKSDKMDGIVMKAVELGVFSIVPVITSRTVVRFGDIPDKVKKRERWQRIAVEAAKQCNRGIIPEIKLPIDIAEAIVQHSSFCPFIMPYENEKDLYLSEYLKKNPIQSFSSVSVLIGPEGGFSQEEAAAASECGIVQVSLGRRVLRTETAGMAALSVIMSSIGEM